MAEVLRALEGDVARDGGEAGEFLELGGAGLKLAQGTGQKLGDIDGVASIDGAGAGRVKLGDPAEVAVALAQLAGEQEAGGVVDGFRLDGDAWANEVLNEAEQIVEVGGLRLAGMPTRWGDGAAEQDGEAFLLAGVVLRQGEEDAAGLEEAELGSALAEVQRGGGDEAWDDAGAEVGVVLAERVFHWDSSGVETLGCGGTEGVAELGLGDEAEGLRLVETAIRHGVAQGHEVVVGAVGGVGGGEGGAETGRHAVEAEHTGEFLDEIDGALQVEAVAGDLPAGGFGGTHFCKCAYGGVAGGSGDFEEAEFFEDAVAFVGGKGGNTEELAGAGFVQFDLAHEGRGSSGDDSVVLGLTPGDGENEAGGGVGRAEGLVGIGPALEAVSGVGVQTEAAGGAADAGGLEVGDFQEDVGGGLGDAGVKSTHDASDGEGFVFVGDDEVVGLEGAGLAVERDEGLALGGVAHDDAAVELGEVEGMERLAHLHEDVVGDINEVVDGA